MPTSDLVQLSIKYIKYFSWFSKLVLSAATKGILYTVCIYLELDISALILANLVLENIICWIKQKKIHFSISFFEKTLYRTVCIVCMCVPCDNKGRQSMDEVRFLGKDDSCDSTLSIYMNYLSMAIIQKQAQILILYYLLKYKSTK